MIKLDVLIIDPVQATMTINECRRVHDISVIVHLELPKKWLGHGLHRGRRARAVALNCVCALGEPLNLFLCLREFLL